MKKDENVSSSEAFGVSNDSVYVKKSPRMLSVITAVVVLAVILLNIAVALLSDSFMWYVDTTSPRYKSAQTTVYSLSQECKSLIERDAIPGIEKVNAERAQRGEAAIKLKIIFCADKDKVEANELMRYVSFTARSLAKEFSHAIETEYINIAQNPSAVQKYKTNSAVTIYDTNVIVEFGTEYLVQNISSFYYQDSGATNPWAYNGEQRLSAMIISLTQAESPICAITNNHGEELFDNEGKVKEKYTSFLRLIEGAGYDVVFMDLEKDEIPENCRMMITFAPTSDFKAYGDLGENNVSEIEKLDKYLDESNAFFYICDRNTPYLASLEEYLEEWGVTVSRVEDAAKTLENYAVKDLTNCTDAGAGNIMLGNYATAGTGASITKDMRSSMFLPKVLFSNATALTPSDSYWRTVKQANETTGEEECIYYSYYRNGISRGMFDVFSTHSTAVAQIGGENYEVATEQRTFKLMTVTMEERLIQESNYNSINKASYVIALSSTDFVSNDILDSAAYGNTDVLLATLRNAGGEAMPARVELKPFYIYNISDKTVLATAGVKEWTLCLSLIPLAIVSIVGVVITVRRKYR
ncbi:MAG: hypothetical protein E7649_02895 [Ruminococcaceae bacterium]|nr:hypothetical protein [Oscillospiraceae bacterium]